MKDYEEDVEFIGIVNIYPKPIPIFALFPKEPSEELKKKLYRVVKLATHFSM
jgi:hypothetical protein